MKKEDKIKILEEELLAYEDARKHLPVSSILGRMSLNSSINRIIKKLDKLKA